MLAGVPPCRARMRLVGSCVTEKPPRDHSMRPRYPPRAQVPAEGGIVVDQQNPSTLMPRLTDVRAGAGLVSAYTLVENDLG